MGHSDAEAHVEHTHTSDDSDAEAHVERGAGHTGVLVRSIAHCKQRSLLPPLQLQQPLMHLVQFLVNIQLPPSADAVASFGRRVRPC